MCRIAGFWDQRSGRGYDLAEVVDRMKDTLTYGGPDDQGSYVDREHGLALGHRRLSILDLSPSGHQPMRDPRQDVWTVYNGEIYNFREVRAELESLSHKFTSTSDTEVLLQAYGRWGMEMLGRFRGMFAFALWDRPRKKLILARDRAGVKPLYWSFRDGVLVFASELKAFHQFPGFRKELDPEALWFFLQLGYIPGPRSIFRGVQRLEPGTWLELDQGGQIRTHRYWDVQEHYGRRTAVADEQEAEERLEELLVESFRLRLVSDVPVGSLPERRRGLLGGDRPPAATRRSAAEDLHHRLRPQGLRRVGAREESGPSPRNGPHGAGVLAGGRLRSTGKVRGDLRRTLRRQLRDPHLPGLQARPARGQSRSFRGRGG